MANFKAAWIKSYFVPLGLSINRKIICGRGVLKGPGNLDLSCARGSQLLFCAFFSSMKIITALKKNYLFPENILALAEGATDSVTLTKLFITLP